MLAVLILAVALFSAGVLLCIKHDLPDLYRQATRIVVGFLIALVLGSVVYAAEIQPYGCLDVEKYSLYWYAMGCFVWESSH